jgi:uncharacterized protein YggE
MMKRLALALFLFPLWAGAAQPEVPAIIVTGHGEVRVAPDMAVLRFGTVAEAKEAAEAQERAGKATARAVTALRNAGVPGERIATEGIRLHPIYSQSSAGTSRISGYRATHSLKVELHRLEQVGEIIDAVTGAGANQLQSLEFGLQDDSSAEREALGKAAADGRAKAQALARALGVRLSHLIRANEGGASVRPPVPMMEMARAGAASAVQPGELSVEGMVTLEFAVSGREE